MTNGIAILLLLVGLQGPGAAASELACDGSPKIAARAHSEDANRDWKPPSSDEPTQIDIGFQILSLSDIDFIASHFRIQVYADFTWCDPRTAFDEGSEGADRRVYSDVKKTPEDLWIPDLSIANTYGDTEVTDRRVTVHSDGSIRVSAFFGSVVTSRFNLQKFPFDRQTLDIAIESFSFNRDVVVLKPIGDRVGDDKDLYLQEWRLIGLSSRSEEKIEVRDRVPYSRAVFSVKIERESGYYIWKFAVPLVLIVMLSWTVFWMKDESMAGRMRISATAFLTIVAYQFAITRNLPKIGYLTLMDKLMVASFILIALSAFENMLAKSNSERNPTLGQRIDSTSQVMFPLVFVMVIGAVAILSME